MLPEKCSSGYAGFLTSVSYFIYASLHVHVLLPAQVLLSHSLIVLVAVIPPPARVGRGPRLFLKGLVAVTPLLARVGTVLSLFLIGLVAVTPLLARVGS